MKINFKLTKGFTLIEILIAIAIIAVLIGLLIIAINPLETLVKTRDGQRENHVNTIYGALEQYIFQYNEIPDCLEEFAQDAINCNIDLVPVYLNEIPKDPICGNSDSGYEVIKNNKGEVGVRAPCKEREEEIIAGTWE